MRRGPELAVDLRAAVDEGRRWLTGIPEERTSMRPAATVWCPREIVGHLIDSACNNHRRFIVNQAAARLSAEPYAQNEWVERQRYAERPMAELLGLWSSYNAHLADVVHSMPDAVLHQPRGPIAGLSFAYAAVDTDQATIALLVEDYIGHIRHHMRQLRSRLG